MEGRDKKAIYLIRENFEDSLCKRGIACAVSFQDEVFLLTSSSVVKEVKAKLCSCYLNNSALGEICLVCAQIHLVTRI